MKILALLTDGFGGYGGIAQYNRDFTSALASLDLVESVLILPRGGAAVSDGIAKLTQNRGVPNRWLYSIRALILAIRFKPDLIFCGHLYMAPLAWLIAKLLRKPYLLQLHGIEAWEGPSGRWSSIRFAAERAALVAAVSRYTRRRFLGWTNIRPDKVKVLPNTYTPPPPATATKDELKAKYNLASRKVLLTVSRIDTGDRYKGHDKMLTILPDLIKSHPSVTYVIVGDGDDRPRLERIVDEAALKQNVRFAGHVSREELQDYYRLADTYVMPSMKEGFGIVFLEAASFGLPVIGGSVDGSVDALGEGAIGLAVNPEETASWASTVGAVLDGRVRLPTTPSRFGFGAYSRQIECLLRQC